MPQHVSGFFLIYAILKTVNALVVNFHYRLEFSELLGMGNFSRELNGPLWRDY